MQIKRTPLVLPRAYLRGLEGVDLARFLWLEQPLDRADWNGAQYLCGRAPVPIVLDECIYDEADVVRAKAIGARGVKLKLMKHFGMKETARLAHHARNLGLAVLFGNGVATDIGNLAEFLMLASSPDTFTQPCESSGFNKLKDHMLACLIETDGQFAMRQSAEQISRQLELQWPANSDGRGGGCASRNRAVTSVVPQARDFSCPRQKERLRV